MTFTPFFVNDAPCGNERACNALRLARALASREVQAVGLFLIEGVKRSMLARLADWTAEAEMVLAF